MCSTPSLPGVKKRCNSHCSQVKGKITAFVQGTVFKGWGPFGKVKYPFSYPPGIKREKTMGNFFHFLPMLLLRVSSK
jgi:hypothetical protein